MFLITLMVISCRLPLRHSHVKPRRRSGVNCPHLHIGGFCIVVPPALSSLPFPRRGPARFLISRHEREGDQPRVNGGAIGLADGTIQRGPIQHWIRQGHDKVAFGGLAALGILLGGAGFGFLYSQTGSVRDDLRAEIGAVRTEIRTDMGNLESELRAEIGGLRSQVHANAAALARIEAILDERLPRPG